MNLTLGNIADAMHDKEVNFSRDLTRFAHKTLPFVTYWPTRAFTDMMFNEAFRSLDPTYYHAIRSRNRARLANQGRGRFMYEDFQNEKVFKRTPNLSYDD